MIKKITGKVVETNSLKKVLGGISMDPAGPSVCAPTCGSFCGTRKGADSSQYTTSKGNLTT